MLSRETIEIAFLTVIQLLTPPQQAALIVCDVLGWSAKEAAALLDISTAAARRRGWHNVHRHALVNTEALP